MIWGLPNDPLSVENGVLTTRSQRWPLMIDPQGQANHWIRNMEAENNLKVLKMGQDKYLQQIENAMRIGQVCTILFHVPCCPPNVHPHCSFLDSCDDPWLLSGARNVHM